MLKSETGAFDGALGTAAITIGVEKLVYLYPATLVAEILNFTILPTQFDGKSVTVNDFKVGLLLTEAAYTSTKGPLLPSLRRIE